MKQNGDRADASHNEARSAAVTPDSAHGKKRPYARPRLKHYGSMAELTRNTGPFALSGDFLGLYDTI